MIKIIPVPKRSLVSEYFSAALLCKERRPSPWQQAKGLLVMPLSDATSETKFTGKETQKCVQNGSNDDS